MWSSTSSPWKFCPRAFNFQYMHIATLKTGFSSLDGIMGMLWSIFEISNCYAFRWNFWVSPKMQSSRLFPYTLQRQSQNMVPSPSKRVHNDLGAAKNCIFGLVLSRGLLRHHEDWSPFILTRRWREPLWCLGSLQGNLVEISLPWIGAMGASEVVLQ